MNSDSGHRKYRYVEVLQEKELVRNRRGPWLLVQGWLDVADSVEPGSPNALLEGDYLATLPDGSVFKEVSFKVEHRAVEQSLPVWAASVGRRWAHFKSKTLVLSDGNVVNETAITFRRV